MTDKLGDDPFSPTPFPGNPTPPTSQQDELVGLEEAVGRFRAYCQGDGDFDELDFKEWLLETWQHQSREQQMVVLRRDESGKPTIFCDPDIADIVQALNSGGVPTKASCSGHGKANGNVVLKDGRELIIAQTFKEARAYEELINGQ